MPRPHLSSRVTGYAQRFPTPQVTADRLDWRTKAACLNAPPELFEYGSDRNPDRQRRIARALLYCRTCPVAAECLEDGQRHQDEGIRGGQMLPPKRF